MNTERYWPNSLDTIFPLDKNSKKSYNGINQLPNNKNVFDDETANSALSYLYSDNNRNKTQSFLQSNGKWIVHATLSDKYDFTEFMTFKDDNGGWSTQASLGTVANDVAVASQIFGAINPYHVTVDFYTTR